MNSDKAFQWIEQANADGWLVEELYPHNPNDRSTRLSREGWTIHIYIQPHQDYQVALTPDINGYSPCHIHAWGPDQLVVKDIPDEYPGLPHFEKQLTKCLNCGAEGETVRLGFADRVCPTCRTELVAKVEYRGWCN